MSIDRVGSISALRLSLADAADQIGVRAAIELGNRSRATLGHMPFAGYTEAAVNGTLLLAYLDGEVIGYALYALARSRVRLIHLCVDPAFRGRGIARRMIEFISQRHADLLGIAARCRRDYNLGETWIKLGFARLSERPGRGRAGHKLVDWWRDHYHGNLFTPDPDTVLVRAALDMNVLHDMADERPDSDESRALLADHLIGLLELVRTPAIEGEIDALTGSERARFTRQLQLFTAVRTDSVRRAEVIREIRHKMQEAEPGWPRTDQERHALQHIADAVAADLNVFITCDDNMRRALGSIGSGYGLRLLRPAEVIVHIDELVRAESYRPVELFNTAYELRLIGNDHERDMTRLTNLADGESTQELLAVVRGLALAGHDRNAIFTPAREIAAVFSAYVDEGVLTVPLLRVAIDGPADTLARQLMFLLRERARTARVDAIRICDPHLSRALRRAASDEGFHSANGCLHGLAIDATGPAATIEERAATAALHAGLSAPPQLRSDMHAVAAAEFERIWWPAKITDSALPSYLIPIRQAYSGDLLGVPLGLTPRNEALGLAREHVYYKSPGGTPVEAPARLLWYMSEGGKTKNEPAAVIACSQLDEVVVGAPGELHARFQHLGVWDNAAVVKAARNGRVQALRFTNTEIFPAPVCRDRLRELSQRFASHSQVPIGPQRIPVKLFEALYEEGRTA